MNKEEIMRILPHRDCMLLLDEAEVVDGEAHGKYAVRRDEFFLQGHFPGNPIVPGVILCEIMAQTTCVLVKDQLTEDKLAVYAGLNNVKFRAPVRVGDVLETRCRVMREKYPFYFAKGEAYVAGKLCASAEMSFAITNK